jgi:hypothetical protein
MKTRIAFYRSYLVEVTLGPIEDLALPKIPAGAIVAEHRYPLHFRHLDRQSLRHSEEVWFPTTRLSEPRPA